MDSRLVLGLALACACNAHLDDKVGADAPVHPDSRPNPATDAGPDAFVFGPWSTPTAVPGASDSTLNIDDETVSSQLTEAYFGIVDTALTGTPKQLWVM